MVRWLFLNKVPFGECRLRREPRPLGLSLGTKPKRDEGSAERTGSQNDVGWLCRYIRENPCQSLPALSPKAGGRQAWLRDFSLSLPFIGNSGAFLNHPKITFHDLNLSSLS